MKKYILILGLLILTNCFVSFGGSIDLDDENLDWDSMSFTENSQVFNKARSKAAQRSANMSIMSIDSVDTTHVGQQGEVISGVGSRYEIKTGDAHLNYVNTDKVYSFADEVDYPFSYLNWPGVADKEQLYIEIKMDNTLIHANWACIEVRTQTPVCNSDHSPNYDCKWEEKGPKVQRKPVIKKCNEQPWTPKINVSFGRYFQGTNDWEFTYSDNSCTTTDRTGHWGKDLGSLYTQAIHWTPTSVKTETNDPARLVSDHYGTYSSDMHRNRIYIKQKVLLTEIKNYGENTQEDAVTEGELFTLDDILSGEDGENLIKEGAQQWFENQRSSMQHAPDPSVQLMIDGNLYPNVSFDELSTSDKNTIIEYYKNNIFTADVDID